MPVSLNQNYLDANAYLPPSQKLLEAFGTECLPRLVGNPSSIHRAGRKAKSILNEARENIARVLGLSVDPEAIYFTSSGTESNQQIIKSLFLSESRTSMPRWAVLSTEHDSTLQMVPWFQAQGGQVEVVPVDSSGAIKLDALKSIMLKKPDLFSLSHVNAETGIVHPIEEIFNMTQEMGCQLHVDAAQSFGKIDIDPSRLDFLSVSGHKIGAFSGSGAIFVRAGRKPSNRLAPVIFGNQEKGLRGGTENVVGVWSFGYAAKNIHAHKNLKSSIELTRDTLENKALEAISDLTINSRNAPRIYNTTSMTFGGLVDPSLVMALDLEGYCVSSGSACSSGTLKPSHVLLAMGRSQNEAKSSLRCSFQTPMSNVEIESFVVTLKNCVQRQRTVKQSSKST